MDTQVQIELRSSRAYLILSLVLALMLFLVISRLPLDDVLRWCVYLALAGVMSWLLWRDIALRSGHSCTSLVCGKDGRVSLVQRNGERVSGVLRADTLVLPWLILLNVDSERGGRSLLLFPDAMAGDAHRRLRVLLRNSEWPQA